MKKIVCEMCGDSNMVKEDGLYICQTCGSKFTVEEARKMMVEIEGTVNVQGTVSIDHSNEEKVLIDKFTIAIENHQFDEAYNISGEFQKLGSSSVYSQIGLAVNYIKSQPIDGDSEKKALVKYNEILSKCNPTEKKNIEIFFINQYIDCASKTVRWAYDLLAKKCVEVEYKYETMGYYNRYMMLDSFERLKYFYAYKFEDENYAKEFKETTLRKYYELLVDSTILLPNAISQNVLNEVSKNPYGLSDESFMTKMLFNVFYLAMITEVLINKNNNPRVPHPYAQAGIIQFDILYGANFEKEALDKMYSNMLSVADACRNFINEIIKDSPCCSRDFNTLVSYCNDTFNEIDILRN